MQSTGSLDVQLSSSLPLLALSCVRARSTVVRACADWSRARRAERPHIPPLCCRCRCLLLLHLLLLLCVCWQCGTWTGRNVGIVGSFPRVFFPLAALLSAMAARDGGHFAANEEDGGFAVADVGMDVDDRTTVGFLFFSFSFLIPLPFFLLFSLILC